MEMLELTPDMLLRAYAIGMFPMAEDRDDPELFWFDPPMRGIIPLDDFHVPRRLQRTVRSGRFHVTFDHAFEEVIEGCSEATEIRPRSWINDRIVTLYTSLFHMRHAHSVECWREGELVGGLYGVSLGGAFFGESMFSRDRDASKVALVHLVARLRDSGFRLLDSQFITDHLSQFGAMEIPRKDYRAQLAEALNIEANFNPDAETQDMSTLLQRLDNPAG
jgi:leucyl/phenylalanyl-tRNA--protein transferase